MKDEEQNSKKQLNSALHISDVVCSADKCIAEEFRKKYPNYSFTTVGYSVSPLELNKEYQSLVDISCGSNYRGSEETHNCKICKKEVYDRTHR